MAITINGTTGIAGVDGSASTPALQGSDTNTGIAFPAADTVAFATGGSERMRIDSSGNVGIGISPSARLSIKQAANSTLNGLQVIRSDTSAYGVMYMGGDDALYIQNQANGAMVFHTNAAERMRINSSGNVGIGVTAPHSALEVNTVASTPYQVVLGNAGQTSFLWGIGREGVSTGNLEFRSTSDGFSSSTVSMAISPAGNVLVGTTNSSGTAGVGTKQIANATVPYFTTVVNDSIGSNYYLLYNTNATNNGFRFYVNSNGGISNYSANNINLSDQREKKDFAPAKNYLDTICAIPVQTFRFIDQMENDSETTLGVVAQDVQSVAPELVTESNWGSEENPKMRLSIYQTDFQYALMKAIQELKADLDATKAELAALKGAA